MGKAKKKKKNTYVIVYSRNASDLLQSKDNSMHSAIAIININLSIKFC